MPIFAALKRMIVEVKIDQMAKPFWLVVEKCQGGALVDIALGIDQSSLQDSSHQLQRVV